MLCLLFRVINRNQLRRSKPTRLFLISRGPILLPLADSEKSIFIAIFWVMRARYKRRRGPSSSKGSDSMMMSFPTGDSHAIRERRWSKKKRSGRFIWINFIFLSLLLCFHNSKCRFRISKHAGGLHWLWRHRARWSTSRPPLINMKRFFWRSRESQPRSPFAFFVCRCATKCKKHLHVFKECFLHFEIVSHYRSRWGETNGWRRREISKWI